MIATVGIAEIQLTMKNWPFFIIVKKGTYFAMITYRTYEQLTPVCDNVSA